MAKTVLEIKSHKQSPEEVCEDVSAVGSNAPQSVRGHNHSEHTQHPRKVILLEELQETKIDRKCHRYPGLVVC